MNENNDGHLFLRGKHISSFWQYQKRKSLSRQHRQIHALERFSTLLSSEGSEESKILSAQMLVIPLLKQTSQHTVFRDTSLHMLIDSILRDNSHGSKLICELLDIVAILLEHMQAEYMTDYRRNDVLKFIWSVLKNNDAATKYNAYVALARFISIFDAPSNMVTELYQLLLRDNTERNKVRAAIDILLPVLRTKLSNCELEFAQKYTIDMIRDELKVITQMVHLWSTVTRHPDLFCSFKSEIIPLMVQSISFLGLQPNESIDAMRLTVDLAKLVLSWCAVESSSESAGNDQATKLKIAYFDQHSGNIVVNTLIRLAFLAARGRLDHARQRITMNILSVLKGYVSSRQNCDVNSAWFFREIRVQGSNKNDKETSRKSRKVSSNITEGSDGVDAVSLHIGAEIILILLQHDPRNEFLGSNICSLLSRFFAAFANPKEKLHLAHAVEDMLVHLLADGHASNETISYIVVNLEKALRVDTSFNHNSHSNELKRLAVSVIEKVCKTHPYFIESFVCSLVALVESLAKQHTKEATDRASNAMQQMTETGFQHQLAATPTLGTFEIACGLGFKPQSPGNDVQISNGGFKSQVVIVNENISRSLRILISAITLLGSSDSTFTFSTSRRSFIAALGTILDFSCSVPVLMAAVSVIGNWITVDRLKTPLTACERECFLWQLCFLDLQRLPELSSQALGDLIGCIILSVYGYSSSNRWEYPFGTVEPTPTCNVVNQNKRTKGVIHEESFQKLFVSCSLSSNPQIRSVSMGIRSLQLNDCGLVHQKLSNFANEIGCGEGDHLDVAGIPDASKSNILMDVLQLDFESLGKRLWTTVIVDTLLASCKHGAGVRLAHRGSKSLLIQRTGKAPRLLQGYFRLYFENPRSSDYVLDLSNDEHDGGAYSKFTTLLRAQRSENECGRGRCIAAVRNLIQGDADTCQSMLELCLHSVWQSLPDNTARASLIKPLGTLLAQPYHSQHGKSSSHRQINSIQSMLRSIIRLRPMPMIDNVLLLSLGENYSVRNEVLCLLECQYISLKANGYDVDSPSHDLKEAIQQCYESLGDRDMSIAISSLRASLPGTKFALSLDMYDLVNESANAYHALIERAVGDQADFLPTASEIALWEARWVDAHKELGQWSVIEEFASSTGDTNLLLECAWKTNNWEKVSSLCSLPSVGAALEDGDPLTKLTQIYLAIHSENLGEIENLHAQSAQLCLHRWRLLPDIGTARDSHKCLLQQFQRLVELRESSQIMVETSSQSAKGAIPDLKLLLSSWRHRLPNSFERVSEWNDIFLWRLNIFDSISSKFAWTNDQNTIATLHDRPFVCLLLGRASRKQGLMDASAFSLNSLSGGTMEVEYAFLKLREQVVNCREHSLQGGLNLVNSTNLSFFDSRQKAEMFRLKALFYQLSNEKPKANQAFCHAVQMCPTYARTWVDWGRLCASLSDDAATQSGDASECKNLAKKTCLYLVQAMGCL